MGIVIVVVVGYLLGAAVTLLLGQRLVPRLWFRTDGGFDRLGYRLPGDGTKLTPLEDDVTGMVSVMFWPLGLPTILLCWLSDVNLRSLNEQRTLRAQMEKDLAAARKEIDELLARDK